ncbi:MAG: hypothetical protein ABR884_04310 [Minisyncoccia bacterium]|jgi:hypothetical protein
MGSNFGLFLFLLIVITFFAPLFMGGGVRKPQPALRDIELKLLKKAVRRAYVWYMIGVTLYVGGMVVAFPASIGMFNLPRIVRFEEIDLQTQVVIYNHFVLTSREFDIYFLTLPLFLLAAALGMRRFEKSHEIMKGLEQRIKELS